MLPKPYFYDARFLGGAVVVPFLGGGLLLRCFKLSLLVQDGMLHKAGIPELTIFSFSWLHMFDDP